MSRGGAKWELKTSQRTHSTILGLPPAAMGGPFSRPCPCHRLKATPTRVRVFIWGQAGSGATGERLLAAIARATVPEELVFQRSRLRNELLPPSPPHRGFCGPTSAR